MRERVHTVIDESKGCMVDAIDTANLDQQPLAGDSVVVESVPIPAGGTFELRRCGRCALQCLLLVTDTGTDYFAPFYRNPKMDGHKRAVALCPEQQAA